MIRPSVVENMKRLLTTSLLFLVSTGCVGPFEDGAPLNANVSP